MSDLFLRRKWTLKAGNKADFHRTAPIDVLRFSEESALRFIDQDGYLHLTHDDVEWSRIW